MRKRYLRRYIKDAYEDSVDFTLEIDVVWFWGLWTTRTTIIKNIPFTLHKTYGQLFNLLIEMKEPLSKWIYSTK